MRQIYYSDFRFVASRDLEGEYICNHLHCILIYHYLSMKRRCVLKVWRTAIQCFDDNNRYWAYNSNAINLSLHKSRLQHLAFDTKRNCCLHGSYTPAVSDWDASCKSVSMCGRVISFFANNTTHLLCKFSNSAHIYCSITSAGRLTTPPCGFICTSTQCK